MEKVGYRILAHNTLYFHKKNEVPLRTYSLTKKGLRRSGIPYSYGSALSLRTYSLTKKGLRRVRNERGCLINHRSPENLFLDEKRIATSGVLASASP